MLSFFNMDMTTLQWLAFVRVKEEFASIPFKDFRHNVHCSVQESSSLASKQSRFRRAKRTPTSQGGIAFNPTCGMVKQPSIRTGTASVNRECLREQGAVPLATHFNQRTVRTCHDRLSRTTSQCLHQEHQECGSQASPALTRYSNSTIK